MIQNAEMKSLWIARDESGHLFAYNHKPTRAKDIWYDDNGFNSEIGNKLTDDWFPYLRWEDEPVELVVKAKELTMEREIGEVFECKGEWYQCIEDENKSCGQCDLSNFCPYNRDLADNVGNCSKNNRSDGESICFKKLEKVGESYVAYGKVRQKYKLHVPLTITNGIIDKDISCDDVNGIVDIEIKQNKEDMEEQHTIENYPTKEEKIAERIANKVGKEIQNQLEKNLKLKPFNLEQAKTGKPVRTRDGRKARIICFDKNDSKTIVALIQPQIGSNREAVVEYHNNGQQYDIDISDNDLMMPLEKKEGWVNMYKMKESTFGYITAYFDTEEKAKEDKEQLTGYVATVKINWEE